MMMASVQVTLHCSGPRLKEEAGVRMCGWMLNPRPSWGTGGDGVKEKKMGEAGRARRRPSTLLCTGGAYGPSPVLRNVRKVYELGFRMGGGSSGGAGWYCNCEVMIRNSGWLPVHPSQTTLAKSNSNLL